jgi:hypothetical protein
VDDLYITHFITSPGSPLISTLPPVLGAPQIIISQVWALRFRMVWIPGALFLLINVCCSETDPAMAFHGFFVMRPLIYVWFFKIIVHLKSLK